MRRLIAMSLALPPIRRIYRTTKCIVAEQTKGENLMQYVLLIYGAENRELSPEAQGAEMQAYFALNAELRAQNALVQGEALMPAATATTVRVRDGQRLVTDGPFAETREVLGGYYVVEAPDLDAAIAIAAKIPGAQDGSVEIRPLVVFG
jgi:hypothetical protein